MSQVVDGVVEQVEVRVTEDIKQRLERKKEQVTNPVVHLIKQEKLIEIQSGYSWGTDYTKEKYEEKRTLTLPEGTSLDTVYVYQLLTNADLRHMVIFNAHNQGSMEEKEFLELLNSTKRVLERALPYIRTEKENDTENYKSLASLYVRLRGDLEEWGLVKTKKADGKAEKSR